MPPNQIQTPVPPDYLNQIAPQAPRRSPFGRKQLIIVGGIIVVLFTIIAIAIVATTSSSIKPSQRLAARLQVTAEIVSDSQATIKDNNLRVLNSNLNLLLTNINRDIASPLASNGINVEKLDEKIIAAESGDDLTQVLEDARLNAVFDRTYSREMSYRLETILALIDEVDNSTRNVQLKNVLSSAKTNLEPVQQQFSEFNADS